MSDGEYSWERLDENVGPVWRCRTREVTIELWPRPHYCDRGRWQAHVECAGVPTNPNPVDLQDGFPRYYFSLSRGIAEMEAFMRERGYKPLKAENCV